MIYFSPSLSEDGFAAARKRVSFSLQSQLESRSRSAGKTLGSPTAWMDTSLVAQECVQSCILLFSRVART